MTLWEIDIYPAARQPDLRAQQILAEAADLGIDENLSIRTARGYLVEGDLHAAQVERLAQRLLGDSE